MNSLAALALAIFLAALLSVLVRHLPKPSAVPMADRWHRRATPTSGGIAPRRLPARRAPGLFSGAISRDYLPLIVGTGAAFAARGDKFCATSPNGSSIPA